MFTVSNHAQLAISHGKSTLCLRVFANWLRGVWKRLENQWPLQFAMVDAILLIFTAQKAEDLHVATDMCERQPIEIFKHLRSTFVVDLFRNALCKWRGRARIYSWRYFHLPPCKCKTTSANWCQKPSSIVWARPILLTVPSENKRTNQDNDPRWASLPYINGISETLVRHLDPKPQHQRGTQTFRLPQNYPGGSQRHPRGIEDRRDLPMPVQRMQFQKYWRKR